MGLPLRQTTVYSGSLRVKDPEPLRTLAFFTSIGSSSLTPADLGRLTVGGYLSSESKRSNPRTNANSSLRLQCHGAADVPNNFRCRMWSRVISMTTPIHSRANMSHSPLFQSGVEAVIPAGGVLRQEYRGMTDRDGSSAGSALSTLARLQQRLQGVAYTKLCIRDKSPISPYQVRYYDSTIHTTFTSTISSSSNILSVENKLFPRSSWKLYKVQ